MDSGRYATAKECSRSLLLALLLVASLPTWAVDTPLVMLALSRDESWFHAAYPDNSDLDGDGVLEASYVDTIDYGGYFHPHLCYRYEDANKRFVPAGKSDGSAHNHYCTGALADSFSGNFLNWATMTRMDLLRRALYGGLRSSDSGSLTILERAHLPSDGHSFAKYYDGADLDKLTPFDTARTDRSNGGNHDGFDNADEGITICNTSYDGDATHFSQNSTALPMMRVVSGNRQLWDTNERWQCTWESEHGDNLNSNDSAQSGLDVPNSDPPDAARLLTASGSAERVVRVLACDPAFFDAADNAEQCRAYPSGVRKPAGILQRYGESGQFKFGLMTGSWSKNISGGALRKAIGDVTDEINTTTNGTFKAAPSTGSIINTLNILRMWGYQNSDGAYFPNSDNCGLQRAQITDGTCRAWGNPVSEIYLETLRYFALSSGRAPTPAFDPNDNGTFPGMIDIPWITDPLAGRSDNPSLNVLVINGAPPSYDDDATNSPILGGNTPQALTATVGAGENINGNSFAVGRVGANGDEYCTLKTVTSLGDVHGICPGGPTLNGSFHIAGLAHYAHTHDLRTDLPGQQSLTTFAVELAGNESTIPIPVGAPNAASRVFLTPAFRLLINSTGGALLKLKVARAHTEVDPSDQSSPGLPNTTKDGVPDISAAGVPTVNYPQAKSGTGIYHGKFYLSAEDSEQGGDYDQDLWGTLDYVVNTTVSPATITITTKVVAQSTSSGSGQLFGFVINGTTKDGFHAYSGILGANFVDPSGVPGCSDCRALSEGAGGQRGAQSYTFVVSNTPPRRLASPLYYAAKWGGFKDANANGVPDQIAEWDARDADGVPDNYFLVRNAGSLDASLSAALARIDGVSLSDFDGDGLPDASDPDDDNDGLPDTWEVSYQLNPLDAADAALDSDGDGRNNLVEYQQGTNPRVPDSLPDFDHDGIPDATDTDDDNDGLPDTWEQQYGFDPLNAADAEADDDHDGRSNLIEYRQGTDPTTAQSAPTRLTLSFEGLQDNEHLEDYFAGGVGTLGSGPGPDYGISFTNPITVGIDADDGGSGNFGGEPSPNTAIGFQTNSRMNVKPGFSGGLSFYYSNPNGDSSVVIYAGPNRTGMVLAVLALPRTPFNGQPDPTGDLSPFAFAHVEFQGVAHSVDFSSLAFSAYLDDLTFYAISLPAVESANVTRTVAALPPPAMLCGGALLAGLGLRRIRRLRKAT